MVYLVHDDKAEGKAIALDDKGNLVKFTESFNSLDDAVYVRSNGGVDGTITKVTELRQVENSKGEPINEDMYEEWGVTPIDAGM